MTLLVAICVAAFFFLLWCLRRDKASLGLPIAYLFSLLLIHVPGAFARIVGADLFRNSDLTEIGMRFTALGSICFVAGVWLVHASKPTMLIHVKVDRQQFWWFCLVGGWVCVYGLSPLYRIPSVSAAVDRGGGIWMLGVLLGLRASLWRGDRLRSIIWLAALFVYPILMLLLGGFLSYGSAAIIIVFAAITISIRSDRRVIISILAFSFLSVSIFVNYFQNRNNIREQVWGGAPFEARIRSVAEIIADFEWFSPTNQQQLVALDERLNQNYFVGLAAQRIEQGQVDYLDGNSVWEGLLALVPRALWPDKPVTNGSPQIVSQMTGLQLSRGTSFGVGNVMECQINFGIPGVAIGFFALGWLLGTLDLKAALAEDRGDLGTVVLFFLPAVALIQPNGSFVDMFSGAAAALVAAWGWRLAWYNWSKRRASNLRVVAGMGVHHLEGSPNKHESTT